MFLLFEGVSQYMWDSYVQTPDRLFLSSKFMDDQFERVDRNAYRGCSYMVYSEDGDLLYASDDQIKHLVSIDEVPFLENGFSSSYYTLFVEADGQGYWIFSERVDEENNSLIMDGYCHVDADYRILEGDLFDGYTYLSDHILFLLSGSLDENNSIYKFEYKNNAGQKRLLIFRFTNVTEDNVNQFYSHRNLLFIFGIVTVFLGMILIALFVSRKVRKSLEPLNNEIVKYGETGIFEPDNITIPKELAYMADTFRKMSLKLTEAETEHREQEREKNRMITDLTHDLKTPLTVIQGYAQALEGDHVPEEYKKQYLQVLKKKSDVSVQMINELMKYASLEHPDYQPHKEETDICELCRSCLAERYMEIDNAGMELDVDIPEYAIMYPTDVKLFTSALENLINNVLRYNPAGTRILFHVHENEKYLEIGIADSGIGIPEEIRKDIFKPFVTGNTARTSSKGTGIGMAIVKRVVVLHGGTIELADSAGSRFSTIITMKFPKNTACS